MPQIYGMMNKRLLRISLILLLWSHLLVSCGGDDSPSDSTFDSSTNQMPESNGTRDTETSSQSPKSASLRAPENATNCTTANHIDDEKSEVIFLWAQSSNTTSYEIHIESLKNHFSFKSNAIETSFKVILEREQQYRWWIVSKSDSSQETATSEKWSFYLQGTSDQYHAPFPAILKGKATKETVSLGPNEEILFEWEGSDFDNDIAFYQLWLGTSKEELELIASEIIIQSYSRAVELDTQYFWQIYTVDDVGNISKSVIQSFSTVAIETEKSKNHDY